MKRNYQEGASEGVTFFEGIEIERTPAYGKETLFVVGVQSTSEITPRLKKPGQHIFFGANHSFHPETAEEWRAWENMITHYLDMGYWCSLDIPLSHVEEFNDGPLNEYNQFIPQIRVPIPFTKLWNYNTMLKIDDKDFNYSNPGIWTHSLHKLMDRESFTDWTEYSKDVILK